MFFGLCWPLIGAGAVAATRFVGEPSAPSPPLASIAKPLSHVDATDYSQTDILHTFEETAWHLQLSVVNDWVVQDTRNPSGEDGIGDHVTQLTVLSLLRGHAPEADISMCVVAFEGQLEEVGDGRREVRGEECGLSDCQCVQDLRSRAAASQGCGFDIPPSCKPPSGRHWRRFDASVTTNDTAHLLAITSSPAKKGSREARRAASAAINRPFLVVTYDYSDSRSLSDPKLVKTHCLMAKRLEEEVRDRTDLKRDNSHNPAQVAPREKSGGSSVPDDEVVLKVVKTSDDDGKASADTARVSMLVAAAALIIAILLAF